MHIIICYLSVLTCLIVLKDSASFSGVSFRFIQDIIRFPFPFCSSVLVSLFGLVLESIFRSGFLMRVIFVFGVEVEVVDIARCGVRLVRDWMMVGARSLMVGFTVRTSTVNSVSDREVVKGVLLFFELALADLLDLTASIVDGREADGIVREG